ncbi:hypothetical protein GALMADRAFT_253406 [Galerina marginata CBS 339.88]|uniref:Glycoside hydrolase family 5 domain-containing protein n=1 Tax=Galerina marginata (strain CBS 339.88) TaxID=685588 RepID=A0A067SLA8_GALM3|nr:hypothetical protein GALMADRAFT_253406 [Galerina marginata CBS 339.88]
MKPVLSLLSCQPELASLQHAELYLSTPAGFPGCEFQIREALAEAIGQEKSEFFFDKFLEYFVQDEDAAFFKSLGLNCIRLPFNYRHFEVWNHKDFQDRVIYLWTSLASHYKSHKWIAGYKPLNEPTEPTRTRLLSFYSAVHTAIHSVDPDHAIFFDGNAFASDFSHFGDARVHRQP